MGDLPVQHRLVGVILTKNEAQTVAECIATLRDWVDAVVVWDSLSTDGTQEIARGAGALVVERAFDNYAAQRQAALDGVAAEWIFFVDADERATSGMEQEVRAVIECGEVAGCWVPRRNFIVGREMRHGGYFPDYQLRLLRRAAARYVAEREVHELVTLTGPAGYLVHPLIHINYTSWAQFHAKQRVYATYEARILAQRGVRPRLHNFVLQPLREFWRRGVTLTGWKDGVPGLRLALLLAWYYGFYPYWLLWRGKV